MRNINFKNPINKSLLIFLCTFLISLLVLYIKKPKFIMKIDAQGMSYRCTTCIFVYSILYSSVTGLVTILILSQKDEIKLNKKVLDKVVVEKQTSDIY